MTRTRWCSHPSSISPGCHSRVSILGATLSTRASNLTVASRASVVNPNISSKVVIGVSCAIIVLIYAIQPFGTGRLAVAFAPIVIIWLMFNFSFGIYVRTIRVPALLVTLVVHLTILEPGALRCFGLQGLLAIFRWCLSRP